MSKRHGGPPEQSVAATALDSSTNLLSFIFAIYFPTYSNGLKEVARWLSIRITANGNYSSQNELPFVSADAWVRFL